ncbi:MAG: class I SAM-dependent RNA methyltransferase [Acidimicrobiales bacterium]
MAPKSNGGAGRGHDAAAVCPPGVEDQTAAELRALGCRPRPAGPGTLAFTATDRHLYAANLWLRTATRVLVRLATFRATDFARLQERAAGLDWGRFLADGVAPRFRVTSTDSKLYHTDAIAQRLHQVVGPPAVDEPEQVFVIRIHRNTVTVSADASGEALHRRAWRTATGPAPLRATMAAAVLMAADWAPGSGLIDPFAGSGTIGIEAALMAAGLPPGGDRSFAFQTWPSFRPGTWASVTAGVPTGPGASPGGVRIVMADRDPSATDIVAGNAERAGVAHLVEVDTRVVAHLRARPGPGLVVTNPPYGRRLGRSSGRPPGAPDERAGLTGLYRRLGAVVRERLPEWGLVVIGPDRRLAAAADGRLQPVLGFRHGGLHVVARARPAEHLVGTPPR